MSKEEKAPPKGNYYLLSENSEDDSVECLFYYSFDSESTAIKELKETNDLETLDVVYLVKVIKKFKVKPSKVTLEELT